jgi:putative acetyltransferase
MAIMTFTFAPGDFTDPKLLDLIRMHVDAARENSPPGLSFALDLSGLDNPSVSFFVIKAGEEIAAMGALMELSAHHGEIKSMRTAPAFLRRGLAAMMLDHLVELGRSRGYHRISLETGDGGAYVAANRLYEKRGFVRGDAFADYQPTPFNIFYHLDLG